VTTFDVEVGHIFITYIAVEQQQLRPRSAGVSLSNVLAAQRANLVTAKDPLVDENET
jgi:hypothetical protein